MGCQAALVEAVRQQQTMETALATKKWRGKRRRLFEKANEFNPVRVNGAVEKHRKCVSPAPQENIINCTQAIVFKVVLLYDDSLSGLTPPFFGSHFGTTTETQEDPSWRGRSQTDTSPPATACTSTSAESRRSSPPSTNGSRSSGRRSGRGISPKRGRCGTLTSAPTTTSGARSSALTQSRRRSGATRPLSDAPRPWASPTGPRWRSCRARPARRFSPGCACFWTTSPTHPRQTPSWAWSSDQACVCRRHSRSTSTRSQGRA